MDDEPVTCDPCGGTGFLLKDHDKTCTLPADICKRNHLCQFCKGAGELTYTIKDHGDARIEHRLELNEDDRHGI